MKQVDEGRREQSLQKALKACQDIRKVSWESQKVLAEIEEIYDENL